ncbi:hypothetical protein M2132_000828 [Dysgonomonas sp. PH5-45]|uniref:hypothetical protein n=1 Tax=unclassified Dysgonomonas TaxID=2630389 RepID=UPI002475F81B|nr:MULTISPECIES: hypothetical protein [unclassified Dysgonomonas]MDH6354500.1 hypothetical protein [Dysgonomonas sp. PH5-45]MDH6387443.1 hypothetical protein [Dysgonomonas sp. PH5-37]
MKKLTFLFIISCCLLSCSNINRKPYFEYGNKEQNEFVRKLYVNSCAINETYNEIKKADIQQQFDQNVLSYMDSVKVLTNWIGWITDIELTDRYYEGSKFKELSFKINIKISEFVHLTLYHSEFIYADSLKNNYMYNKVKELDGYSNVFFDGIIKKKGNTIDYKYEEASTSPNYKFYVTDISQEKLNSELPPNLKKAINLSCEYINNLDNEELKQQLDSQVNTLPAEQKDYYSRVSFYYLSNWLEQ